MHNMEKKKVLTLCIVYDDMRILLGMKKRGFGMGRWNGFGGKIEPGESIEEAARRELEEEVGIVARNLEQKGVLTFTFLGDPTALEVHIFSANSFSGEPRETEEMRPQWYLHADIPYADMWPDDRHWLPLVLAGKSIQGKFEFNDYNTVADFDIREV